MSAEAKDFSGKDVAEAIEAACAALNVAREHLNIEVIETGSKGIFGLIRQKARIRVTLQENREDPAGRPQPRAPQAPRSERRRPETGPEDTRPDSAAGRSAPQPATDSAVETLPGGRDDEDELEEENGRPEAAELSAETLAVVKDELAVLLDRMGCPSEVAVEAADGIVECRVGAEHEATLTAQEGRVLDSLQYLLRKIVARKIPGKIQLTIDVGDYRERRYEELKVLAAEYAALVKKDGKTQVIPSLNPSERRVVHVELQHDPDIRSRSVGEGLFKKVLIFKPGKGKKSNGRRRGRGRSKNKGGPSPKQEA